MDRSVVRRLERDGYVEFHEGRDPYFAISTKGEQLIAQDFLGLISGASGHQ
jgi:DNA-binding PadR family transcriptional regulator